jgi:hypothetical protein
MAETVACPSCQRKLQVPEPFLGQKVQCPECRHMFVAATTTVSAEPMPAPPAESKRKSRPRYDEDDEEDIPRRRSRRDDFDDDDDYDYDDIRDRRRGRNRYPPHRGGIVLALGLVALVGGMSLYLPLLLGPVAWALGSWDLRAMREGNMDPDGISMTQAGQVCGIVATVMLVIGVFCVGFFLFAGFGG